nr:hypothetical protein [Cellvibrio japonicus]
MRSRIGIAKLNGVIASLCDLHGPGNTFTRLVAEIDILVIGRAGMSALHRTIVTAKAGGIFFER